MKLEHDLQILRADISQKETIRNLMQLYLHALSKFTGDKVNEVGLYDCGKYFDAYWTEAERHPYLFLTKGNEAVGFALVRQIEADLHSIAEFFIIRSHRRSGFATMLAKQIFQMHPGRWRVAELENNVPAQSFWRKVIGEITGGDFTESLSSAQPRGPQQEFVCPRRP